MEFRVLKNIEGGRQLIQDENCNFEAEKLEEMADELKSSVYWVSYEDHNG